MTRYDIQNQPTALQREDEVIFTVPMREGDQVLRYSVADGFLNNFSGDNDAIFVLMGYDKTEYCTTYYGCETMGGDWPVPGCSDFLPALTRVILAIYTDLARPGGFRRSLINDSRARVSHKTTIEDEIQRGLSTLATTGVLVLDRPSETTSQAMECLISMGIVAVEGSNYTVKDKEALSYLLAKRNGDRVYVNFAPDTKLISKLLTFIREAPRSVTLETLVSKFGSSGLRETLEQLCSDGILKNWDRGYYIRQESQERATELISASA